MPVPDLPRQFHPPHPVIKQRKDSVQLSATYNHAIAPLPFAPLPADNSQDAWYSKVPSTWQGMAARNLDDCDVGAVPANTAPSSGFVSRTMSFATGYTDVRPGAMYRPSCDHSFADPPKHGLCTSISRHVNHRSSLSIPCGDVQLTGMERNGPPPVVESTMSPIVSASAVPAPGQVPAGQRNAETQAPGPEPSMFSAASNKAYRKLVEPLSDWIAQFIWNVCTADKARKCRSFGDTPASPRQYSDIPPRNLAMFTRSLLLSTLLTPSAIFLSLHYVIRLPAVFHPVAVNTEQEMKFRTELLHLVSNDATSKETSETIIAFRLIVLGFMLANKWLDDHTFSNKTWHTVSNIPITSLNRLETLALDILKHDLSISPTTWTHWLQQLRIYHATRKPHLLPIGRPSSDPHSLIRQAIDDLIEPSEKECTAPVFLGLEQRIRAIQERHEADTGSFEIDLDEDGPLREEYVPRRRAGTFSSAPKALRAPSEMLPPPAEWIPGADPPLMKPRSRYEPLQPDPASACVSCDAFCPPSAPHVAQAEPLAPPPGLSLNTLSAYPAWPPLPAQLVAAVAIPEFARPQWLRV